MAETQDPPELKLEEVVATEPDKLSDEQKTFLQENKDNLTDEQATKFGIEKTEKPINPDDVTPEVRGGQPPPKKKDGEGEVDDKGDEIDPEDEKNIGKIVDKRVGDKLSQVVASNQQIADELEVNRLIVERPEYTKFKAVILKYAAHEAYKNVPIKNIAAMVAADDLIKIGAQREREAQKKAADTRGGGSTTRKVATGIDWSKATPEQVAAQKAQVLGRPS